LKAEAAIGNIIERLRSFDEEELEVRGCEFEEALARFRCISFSENT
jgi:hypothetical protein